jgi:hypothetical protein
MAFFGNKRKDFSIQPPRQQVDGTPFFVTDSANIDFTLENLNLTANLTPTGVTSGTYGSSTRIPILQVDQWGRITGVTTTTFSAAGITLETNGTPNPVQTLLNLVAGTNMTITDDGLGNITFSSIGGGGSGTVTSVGTGTGLTGGPITNTGTISLNSKLAPADTLVGNAGKFLRVNLGESAVEYADVASGGGGGGRSYYLNGSVIQGTFGGIVDMRQMSPVPVIGAGTDFTINTNGYIKSFITDAGDPNKAVIPAGNWNFELWFSANSNGGSPSFYVELSKYDTVGGTFTPITTSSATPEGITNGTAIDLYFTALSVPQTTLALTDRLAVRIFVNNSSRTITLHTQGPHLSQIITDFPSGINSLNGLTAFVQNFATPGTSGTAPNWSSVLDAHTLNIPLASAAGVTAGLISKAEFDTFNGKQDAITLTTTGTSGPATLTGATLNIPQYSSSGGNSIGELTGDVTAGPATSSSESVVSTLKTNLKVGSCGVTFDGGSQVILNGKTAYVQIPYNGTLGAWSMVADQAGACTITVSKGTYTGFPTSSAVYSTNPAIPAGFQKATNAGAYNPGMSTITAGDVLKFDISAISSITWVNLSISITKI